MNDGLINEEKLRLYINLNDFSSYNKNIQEFLKFTFGNSFSPLQPFIAEKKGGQIKPDLCISHNGQKKYISVKKGSGNSVHQEKVDVFFPFVEKLIDTETLNNLKLFHYGDDTINDTGKFRYSAAICKNRYMNTIHLLNKSFNNWVFLEKFIYRFLFVGNIDSVPVDVIYHGTISSGLWATKEEIIEYIKKNKFHLNAVHFGPLTYQVWGRNEKRTAKYPERRYVMQIKWGEIEKDLKQIRKENS